MDDTDDLFRWVRLPAARAVRSRFYLAEGHAPHPMHGHGIERRVVARMGGGAIQREAFTQMLPGVTYRDDTNRKVGSRGNGTGPTTGDGFFAEPNTLGGGLIFGVKAFAPKVDDNGNERQPSEMAFLTGDLSTIETVCGHYRGRWRVHGRSMPALLVKTDWQEGSDPMTARILAFAVINISALVRNNHRFAAVASDHYEWSEELGMHISTGVHGTRGSNIEFPLYVRFKKASKRNKTASHYASMCISLTYLRKHGMLSWTETNHLEEAEVMGMMKAAICKVARSR